LTVEQAILDGEIVALDEKGSSSFQLLQVYRSSEQRVPLVYYVFDLLFVDGKDLRKEPLSARRKLLAGVLKKRLRISGSLKVCRALKRTCFGSPRSLASRGWLPKD
jgi:bifunctional non-homologous end joining protein LigD